jgi:hypothetical protein
MTDHRHGNISSSAIPTTGVGGAGMIGATIFLTIVFPQALWVIGGGLLLGGALAAGMILQRRHRSTSEPGGDSPVILFRDSDAAATTERPLLGPAPKLGAARS